MRLAFWGLVAVAATAPAQRLTSVYNRDTGQPFELKKVESRTVVRGPIAKTTTVYTFNNPYKNLTEASFNFDQPWGSALDGFAYWYKDEYVPGMLMDKEQAWFIYTAITSRNRDPGIMDQVAPNSYHAQIYPLATGYDLRIELQSIEFMHARPDRLMIAPPTWPGFTSEQAQSFSWEVEPMNGGLIKMIGNDHQGRARQLYAIDAPVDMEWNGMDVQLLGQKWTDGATYVSGTVRTSKPTGMVQTYDRIDMGGFKVVGMDEVYIWPAEDSKYAFHFAGVMKSPRPVVVKNDSQQKQLFLKDVAKGDWTSKLFAQAKLTYGTFKTNQDVLDFSLKYQVPSKRTALLAVPKEEWKLFEQKKKEFQAQQRRIQRDQDRFRGTGGGMPGGVPLRPLNWNNSFGGDPEIRVQEKLASRAEAVLPDGRILALKRVSEGWWTVNFEIPADAPEGSYEVRVRFYSPIKFLREQVITYKVDRSAPKGVLTLKKSGDSFELTVKSEAGLNNVTLQLSDGRILPLKEEAPGVYRMVIPAKDARLKAVIMLKDDASNKTVLPCSWPASR